MQRQFMDCLTHPSMCRLFLSVLSAQNVTANQLAAFHPEIAQTTLYRYLKRLTDVGLIKVIKESPVRGTYKKTYAPAVELTSAIEQIIHHNDGQAYMLLFMQYLSGFVGAFRDYCQRQDINLKEDLSAFTTAPIYATDAELALALQQISEIVMRLAANPPGPHRKLRNLGMMLTPPHDTVAKNITTSAMDREKRQ